MGEVWVDHYHVRIGHQRLANDYIVWQPFEDLECFDELLGFDTCGICQSNSTKGFGVFAAPSSKRWWAFGTLIRCEIETCIKSVSFFVGTLPWRGEHTCHCVDIKRHEVVISSRVQLSFQVYSRSTSILGLEFHNGPFS